MTEESAAFVLAMCSNDTTPEERVKLLRKCVPLGGDLSKEDCAAAC